jgi:hypothetical protein
MKTLIICLFVFGSLFFNRRRNNNNEVNYKTKGLKSSTEKEYVNVSSDYIIEYVDHYNITKSIRLISKNEEKLFELLNSFGNYTFYAYGGWVRDNVSESILY